MIGQKNLGSGELTKLCMSVINRLNTFKTKKMKSKYIFVSGVMAFLFSYVSFGQTLTIGAKGGISIPNIRGNTEQSEGYTSREGAYFGLLVNRQMSRNFSLQVEMNYSPQGGKRNKMQLVPADQLSGIELPPGTQLYANFRNKTILNYVEIPVVGQVTLHQEGAWHYHLNLGPSIAFLVKAQTVTGGSSAIYLDPAGQHPLRILDGSLLPPVSFDGKTNIKDEIKKINSGLVGGVGIDYSFEQGSFFLEGRFTLGLTNIQTNTKENGKNHTGSIVMAIGYAYRIR